MKFLTDKNYLVLREAYSMLDMNLEYETVPPEIFGLILNAKAILDEVCQFYELGNHETDAVD